MVGPTLLTLKDQHRLREFGYMLRRITLPDRASTKGMENTLNEELHTSYSSPKSRQSICDWWN
jgi:hypothetical protein